MNSVQVSTAVVPSVTTACAPPDRPRLSSLTIWQELRTWLRRLGCGRLELGLLVLVDLLVVGVIVIAYWTVRSQDAELLAWGQRLLHLQRGLWMTAVLPVGGVALIAALHLARRGRVAVCALTLVVALLAGGTFVTVGVIDFDNKSLRRLVPGKRFGPSERYVAWRFGVRLPRDWASQRPTTETHVAGVVPAVPAKREVSATNGREVFLRVCASCHGMKGEGITGSGKDLRTNEFIASRDDVKLVDFLKVGRQPWDPDNTTKVQMPARGGDPRVTDDDLRDVVAYLRDAQKRAAPTAASGGGALPATQPSDGDPAVSAQQPPASEAPEEPPAFIEHRTYLPEAHPGPRGLSTAYLEKLARPAWSIPDNAERYFGMFFAFTGVGALHVLIASLGVAAVLFTTLRRRSVLAERPAMLVATVAWWWATGCWLLVFRMIYAWR